MITVAIRAGELIRVRRDHYALPGTHKPLMQAVRVGGRMSCITALASWGVFALDDFPHVHLTREASRLRSPNVRRTPFRLAEDGATLHWWPLSRPELATEGRVGLVDALAHAVRCQQRHLAVAAIDSALHLDLLNHSGLKAVFSAVPKRFRGLSELIDGRAESGPESVLRLIVRDAGYRYHLQVPFDGTRRMDIVVENRLVLEADSRQAHEGWEKQVDDRTRDLDHATRGLPSLRPLYQHILFQPDRVRRAIYGLIGPPC
jgi:very-short-patch-repair endonuclease